MLSAVVGDVVTVPVSLGGSCTTSGLCLRPLRPLRPPLHGSLVIDGQQEVGLGGQGAVLV